MNKIKLSIRSRRLLVGGIIFVVTVAGLLFTEARLRPMAAQGLYIQDISSEEMMQTVSVQDLVEEPVLSLWNLHIQPPAFDALRALIANVVGSDDAMITLWKVDYCLLIIWALICGLIVFLIYWWLSDITDIVFGAVFALLFSVSPSLLFYATLLETTLLSSLLVLWFCFLLWRIKEGRSVSSVLLAISFLGLYFTRSVFQWHWLLLLPACLILLRYPWRKLIVFFVITSLFVGGYTAKQMTLFGISSTSSFAGVNLCRAIGDNDPWTYYGQERAPNENLPLSTPRVLSRVKKVDGAINFNHAHYLELDRTLRKELPQKLRALSVKQIILGVRLNMNYYLLPSIDGASNILVDRLPWRLVYDIMGSAPILPLLLAVALGLWLRQADKSSYISSIGLCLPIIAIVAISVLCERGENMRFKFFIEPVLYCFIASQIYASGRCFIRSRSSR